MREIDIHHDGHGLNESLKVDADEVGPGGASHYYRITIGGDLVATAQFQEGPRNVVGSTPGITEAALLAVLIDRLRGFQAGPYACEENRQQLTHLEAALALTRARADGRARRGVLGTYNK